MSKTEKDSIRDNIKRASVEILLLALLNDGDKYGYQMTQELKKRTDCKIVLLEGSMYPILYKLTEEGCVTYEERQAGRRRTRVYYHLTKKGHKKLESLIRDFREQINVVESLLSKVS